MKLSDLVSKYYLQDSLIAGIRHLHDERKLIVEIELCNWKQALYKEGDPEMIFGSFVFSGVEKYDIQPITLKFDSDEVLEVKVLQLFDGSCHELIKMILHGTDDIKIINILANDVEWVAQ